MRGVKLGSKLPKTAARGARAEGQFPAGTLSPAQILTAYGFKQNQFAGLTSVTKLGIGSLGGGVVQADIDNAVAAWGMLAPKLTVRTVGGATNDPTADTDANVENSLDIVPTMAFAYWFLTGQAADITICFGPNASNGMTLVTQDLVAAGVEVASWSWGSAADQWDPTERAALAAAFQAGVQAGVTFCAASGDNSIDDGTSSPSADYPASDPCVWGVGGTNLQIAADGSRASESAWGDGNPGDEGGGGGFDPTVAEPPFQQGIVPSGQGRGVPDSAANADPNSGWQMSANGQWTVVGGTSAASPFTAALIAVAKAIAKLPASAGLLTPAIYAARATACNDITTGSNGDPAAVGWDPATGLGSPNAAAFIAALTGATPPAQQPAPPAPAPTPAPAPPISAPAPTQPAPPPVPAPPHVSARKACLLASQGIVQNYPTDGSTPALADVQGWASDGLASGWPTTSATTSTKP